MADLRATLPVAALLLAPVTTLGWAQQFRVETEVFEAEGKQPIAESLTLFSGDVVYDFVLGETPETTMFDIRRGRIVTLDPNRKIQTVLTTENLLEFCTAMKTRPASSGNEGLFHPQFQTAFDETARVLTLSSDTLVYQSRGEVPKDAEAAARYQQFADWYARLNAFRPGNLPPFGRIELNRALAERNLVPMEVTRTVTMKRTLGSKRLVHRSVHHIHWTISNSDRSRIETVGDQLTSFPQVAVKDYWAPGTE